jgi:soluble lytic murein transglycosylase-like protein
MTLTNALSLFSLLASLSAPPAPLDVLRDHAAAVHGVDPALLACIVEAESGGDAAALGAAGEVGLMQIMPETGALIAAHAGVTDYDLWEPAHNLWLGAYGLSRWPEWWTTYPQCRREE